MKEQSGNSAMPASFSALSGDGAYPEYIQVNGVQIGIEQRGKQGQSPLVLLHGFTGSAAGWGTLLDNLALRGLHVVALDMLGHGRSEAPDDPQRYSMEHCCADIIDVLQALGIGQGEAILLGYSMGGRIALYCALSGFFRALILESASPGIADPSEREQRRRSDSVLADRIEREGVPAFVAYWENLPLFASQRSLPVEVREALHEQRLNNRANGLANSLRGVGTGIQPTLHHRLSTLTIPTLLIAGEFDHKFCEIARQMKRLLLCSQLQIVPGAGHTVHLEQPIFFVDLVGAFCSAVLS